MALPDYPFTYDANKALNAAANARGNTDFAVQWAGQGAPLAREMPAAALVKLAGGANAVLKGWFERVRPGLRRG